MDIVAVIVTYNRLELLSRSMESIKNQSRRPDYIYVISNSSENNFISEQILCKKFNFTLIKNYRTKNNAGAINTAIEEILKLELNKEKLYIALLDDDDEWLNNYLEIMEKENNKLYDILLAELSRINGNSQKIQNLPNEINTNLFLKGNPGIGNSNTFVKLVLLLKAGCYDEACLSNIDRDLFIRLFELNPTYKVVNKHLINHFTDNDRPRITNNIAIRKKSFQYFYYKYSSLMSNEVKKEYFDWAEKLFNIKQEDIVEYEK